MLAKNRDELRAVTSSQSQEFLIEEIRQHQSRLLAFRGVLGGSRSRRNVPYEGKKAAYYRSWVAAWRLSIAFRDPRGLTRIPFLPAGGIAREGGRICFVSWQFRRPLQLAPLHHHQ